MKLGIISALILLLSFDGYSQFAKKQPAIVELKNQSNLVVTGIDTTLKMPDRNSLKMLANDQYQFKGKSKIINDDKIHWYALENENDSIYWQNVNCNKLIVEFKRTVDIESTSIKDFLKKNRLNKITSKSLYPELQNFYVFQINNGTKSIILDIIKKAKLLTEVLYAEPEAIIKSLACTPNDTYWSSQWGPYVMRADTVWCFTDRPSKNWTAVIDDAIAWNHPDLNNTAWYGYDYAMNDAFPTPDYTGQDHGTHVSGVIGAERNNGVGIAGMSKDTLYFAKVWDNNSLNDNASVDGVANALNTMSTINKIKVVNMSLGGYNPIQVMQTAINNFINSNKLVIAAAGNDNTSNPMYPAAWSNVISVSSVGVNASGNLIPASYSNYGTTIDVSAPGGESATGYYIISTLPNNTYGGPSWVGTSMAAPHVTGLAAIVWAANPFLSNSQVRTLLEQQVYDLGTPGWDQYYGSGMCNAWGAFYNACMQLSINVTASGSTTFCNGNSLTLNAPYNENVTYQWRKDGVNINGATSNTFTSTASGNYSLYIQTVGCQTTSNVTAITVNSLPTSLITASGPTTFCSGGSVVLNANTGTGFTYQWKKDGANISGSTASSYTATVAGSYTVVVTNSSNCSSTSNATIVTVNNLPSTPSVLASGATNFCQGGSLTLTSSSSNGNQWYNNGILISGATGSTYTATASGLYTVITTTGSCASLISNAISLTVSALPSSVITVAGPTSFCAGGSVVLNANTGTGLTYQWKKDGTNIIGATASSYTATVAGSYTVGVTNSSNCSSTSNATIVTVNNLPSTPSVMASGATNFCQGGSVTLTSSSSNGNQWYNNGTLISGATGSTYSATATGVYTVITTTGSCASLISNAVTVTVNALPSSVITTAGPTAFCSGGSVVLNANTGTGLTYQWKKDGANISGVTASSYTATTAGSYTVVVTNSSNCSSTSNATIVTVNNLPSTPSVVASGVTNFCQGGSVTLTSSSSNGNQWYNNGTLISGATSPTYTATTTGVYTVITTTGSCASLISNAVTVTVNALPSSVITAAGPTSFCSGGSVVLNANTGTGLTYQWKKDGTNISGATSSSFTATVAGSYTVLVTNSSNCSSTSNATIVTVNNIPTTPTLTATGNLTFCQGGSVTLTSSSSNGNQWYNNGTLIPVATGSTYLANGIGVYTVTSTTGSCASPISNAITVTVNALPSSVITAAGPTAFCVGGSVVLNANTGTGLTYQWKKDGTDISGVTASSFTATVAGSYTVLVTNSSNCSSTSNATIVTIGSIPTTPSISWNGTQLSTTATGVSYQWFLNGNVIPGATSANHSPTSIGVYKVTVTANGCSNTSDNYTLVVTGIDPTLILSPYTAQVYPNPAKNDFAIKFGETPNVTLDIQLINNLGIVLKSIKTKNNLTTIKVNELPSGLYFIKIIGGAFNQVKKIEIIK